MDKNDLPDGIYEKAKNFKIRGSSGKVNIALSGMPKFTGVPDNRYINRGGQGFTGSLETMERAYDCWKHGRWSDDPFIESVIPSAWDPTVAPPGKHWMSNFVQYCPAELADGPWTPEKRDQFGQSVIDKIERYSPGFRDLIVHMEVRTPHEIEQEIGLTEGNIFQGELTIDQLFFNRPFPGYAPVPHAGQEHVHVRLLNPSGRRRFLRLRRQRGTRNPHGPAAHEHGARRRLLRRIDHDYDRSLRRRAPQAIAFLSRAEG